MLYEVITNNVEHILPGQRLEIELIRGVVVGGHGLRITSYNVCYTKLLRPTSENF